MSSHLFLETQVFNLPVSTTSQYAKESYETATFLGANIRFEASRMKIDNALEADPDFFMAYVYAYQVLADTEEKVTLLDRALAIDNQNFTEAEKIMRRQMEAWKEDPDALPTEAMKASIAAYPDTPEAYEWASLHAAFAEKGYDAGLAYAEKLVELDPYYPPAYNTIGCLNIYKNQLDEAKIAFEKYIEFAPAESNAYDSMGEYYMINKDYAKSAEYYDRAAALGRKSSQALADKAHAMLNPATAKLMENIEHYENTWDKIVNQGQIDLINTDNFADDVVLVASPENIVGVEAFKAYYNNYLTGFSDISFAIVDIFWTGRQNRQALEL